MNETVTMVHAWNPDTWKVEEGILMDSSRLVRTTY